MPFIKLINAKGIPANYLTHLEKQINDFCFKIIGEVMIFELVQYIQVIVKLLNVLLNIDLFLLSLIS